MINGKEEILLRTSMSVRYLNLLEDSRDYIINTFSLKASLICADRSGDRHNLRRRAKLRARHRSFESSKLLYSFIFCNECRYRHRIMRCF